MLARFNVGRTFGTPQGGTVAILAQGADSVVAVTQAFFVRCSIPAARRSCLAGGNLAALLTLAGPFFPGSLCPKLPSPVSLEPSNSAAGTRARVAQVRAEYPNQLHYSGSGLWCAFEETTSSAIPPPGLEPESLG